VFKAHTLQRILVESGQWSSEVFASIFHSLSVILPEQEALQGLAAELSTRNMKFVSSEGIAEVLYGLCALNDPAYLALAKHAAQQ
jgi:hypothetical protein